VLASRCEQAKADWRDVRHPVDRVDGDLPLDQRCPELLHPPPSRSGVDDWIGRIDENRNSR
jgi:hypothetical protein